MTPEPGFVTGGVDTHLEVHVAAAVDHLGGVLGTETFPTTGNGYRRLLRWLRSFGPVHAVGVEGTGSYGSALAGHLADAGLEVIEVSRPNRQVRRRHGKTDVVDAIAAARAVLSGQASATAKAHNGPVEAWRLLKIVQRSAAKSRTQAINQLRTIVATAPDELRSKLRALKTPELVEGLRSIQDPGRRRRPGRSHASGDAGTRPAHPAARRTARAHEGSPAPDHHRGRTRSRGPQGRGSGHRVHHPGQRRRQPTPVAQRTGLRRPGRREPDTREQRQDDTSSAEPRRRPPTQLGAMADHDGPPRHRRRHPRL